MRMKWGKPRETIPSRFLYELTGQADNPRAIAQRQRAQREAAQRRRKVAARTKPPPPPRGKS